MPNMLVVWLVVNWSNLRKLKKSIIAKFNLKFGLKCNKTQRSR